MKQEGWGGVEDNEGDRSTPGARQALGFFILGGLLFAS